MEIFHVNCIHFRGAVFVHVGQAQLCTGNGFLFCMCSAAEVAWLAQNIRHSSTRAVCDSICYNTFLMPELDCVKLRLVLL